MMFLAQSHTAMMEGLLELNSAPPLFCFHSLWALGAAVVHISALSGLCVGGPPSPLASFCLPPTPGEWSQRCPSIIL